MQKLAQELDLPLVATNDAHYAKHDHWEAHDIHICLGTGKERNDVNRYSQDGVEHEKMVPEGVEGRVPFKGWVFSVIDQLTGGIRQSMGYIGCKTIAAMQNETQFVEITNAGMMESHVHDVTITKEPPNYSLD